MTISPINEGTGVFMGVGGVLGGEIQQRQRHIVAITVTQFKGNVSGSPWANAHYPIQALREVCDAIELRNEALEKKLRNELLNSSVDDGFRGANSAYGKWKIRTGALRKVKLPKTNVYSEEIYEDQ